MYSHFASAVFLHVTSVARPERSLSEVATHFKTCTYTSCEIGIELNNLNTWVLCSYPTM